MGFGHRVYKNFDPRAKIIKAAADKVLAKLGMQGPAARHRARRSRRPRSRTATSSSASSTRTSTSTRGIIYRAMGFPTNMFTVLFALGPPARLDRALEGDDRGPDDEDRAARGRSTRARPLREYVPIEKRERQYGC